MSEAGVGSLFIFVNMWAAVRGWTAGGGGQHAGMTHVGLMIVCYDCMGQAGQTPLFLADAECAELLLGRKADVNAVDKVRGWWVDEEGWRGGDGCC